MNNKNIAEQSSSPVLECHSVIKKFREGEGELVVLNGVDLEVRNNETVAIIGASGSGKTTLLQIIGGLDDPTSGEVRITGRSLGAMNEAQKGDIRNRSVGFIYQFHHLLPEFTAEENVAMPLLIRRQKRDEALRQARELLSRVGLGLRLDHRPGELSGGERQRAAVARALITRPSLVLADEPTGNLDAGNGEQVLELMLELNREFETSLVVVTHDMAIARRMSRVLRLEDGKLQQA